jgi:hypothetical protein
MSRANRFRTVESYQVPPRAVRIPRAFSAAAIARDVVACIWRTTGSTGSTFAAKVQIPMEAVQAF